MDGERGVEPLQRERMLRKAWGGGGAGEKGQRSGAEERC